MYLIQERKCKVKSQRHQHNFQSPSQSTDAIHVFEPPTTPSKIPLKLLASKSNGKKNTQEDSWNCFLALTIADHLIINKLSDPYLHIHKPTSKDLTNHEVSTK